MNSPKSLTVLGIDLDLTTFSWPFLCLACPIWPERNSISSRTLAHFISELISSHLCLTITIWANPGVMGLVRICPSLCWAFGDTGRSRSQRSKPLQKLCLMVIFHEIKFILSIFIVKFLKSFILNTNYQILY